MSCKEFLDRTTFRTGRTFAYTFGLEGEGNLAAVNLAAPRAPGGSGAVRPRGAADADPPERPGRRAQELPVPAGGPAAGPCSASIRLFRLIVFQPHHGPLRYAAAPSCAPLVRGPERTATASARRPHRPFLPRSPGRGRCHAPAPRRLPRRAPLCQPVSGRACWPSPLLGWWRAKAVRVKVTR